MNIKDLLSLIGLENFLSLVPKVTTINNYYFNLINICFSNADLLYNQQPSYGTTILIIKSVEWIANMNITGKILVDNHNLKILIEKFLTNITEPVFGASTKKEMEFMIFELLKDIGIINSSSIYKLMTELSITRTKALQLVYDDDVRKKLKDKELDEEIKESFAKDGDYFVLEIERPLLQAYLKEKLRSLGHISDGSFSQSIVRMNLKAVSALMLQYIPKKERDKVRKELIKAGASDESVEGVLKNALKHLGSKVLGESADILVNNASEMIKGLLTSSISEDWNRVFTTSDAKKV